jgi:hypothetical protein
LVAVVALPTATDPVLEYTGDVPLLVKISLVPPIPTNVVIPGALWKGIDPATPAFIFVPVQEYPT